MKKLIALCIAICFCVLFVGCKISCPKSPEGPVDITDYLPQKPDKKPDMDMSGLSKKYWNSVKVKDGFLYFGSFDKKSVGIGVFGGFIEKRDFEGNKLWEKYSSVDGYCDRIYELPNDKGYLVFSEYYREYLVKFDISGNEEWIVKDPKYFSALSVENDGLIVVFGIKTNSDSPSALNDIKIVKFDFAGNIIKQKSIIDSLTFTEGNKEIYTTIMQFNSIVKKPDGYILTGRIDCVFNSFGDISHGPSVQVFIDNDFGFIKQEYFDASKISRYVALDDGFVAVIGTVGGYSRQLKKLDYNMNEMWSLDLKYTTSKDSLGLVAYAGVTIVDGILCIVGFTTQYSNNSPFIVHVSFDGDVLWESGLLQNKANSVTDIYSYENGYFVCFDGAPSFEWKYYNI